MLSFDVWIFIFQKKDDEKTDEKGEEKEGEEEVRLPVHFSVILHFQNTSVHNITIIFNFFFQTK